jgi:hypothetical protein
MSRSSLVCLSRLSVGVVLVLFAVESGSTQSVQSLSGRWRLHSLMDGSDVVIECDLKQHGRDLDGSCTSEQGPFDMSGNASASSFSLQCQSDIGGGDSTVTYVGKLSGTKMMGKISIGAEEPTGRFTGVLVRESGL